MAGVAAERAYLIDAPIEDVVRWLKKFDDMNRPAEIILDSGSVLRLQPLHWSEDDGWVRIDGLRLNRVPGAGSFRLVGISGPSPIRFFLHPVVAASRTRCEAYCSEPAALPYFNSFLSGIELDYAGHLASAAPHPGRPKNSGVLNNLTHAGFHVAYLTLQAEHESLDKDAKVSQAELGTRLIEGVTVSSQTVRRYLKKHGLRWPPDRDLARWDQKLGLSF